MPCVEPCTDSLADRSTIIKMENNQWESKWDQGRVRTRLVTKKSFGISCINFFYQLLLPKYRSHCVRPETQTRGMQCLLSVLTQVADTASLTHTQCTLLFFRWPAGKYTTNNVARYRKKNNSCVSLSKQSCDLCALRREMSSGLFSFGREGLEVQGTGGEG